MAAKRKTMVRASGIFERMPIRNTSLKVVAFLLIGLNAGCLFDAENSSDEQFDKETDALLESVVEFQIRSQSYTGVITRDDPLFDVACELLVIGRQSYNLQELHVSKKHKEAAVHVLRARDPSIPDSQTLFLMEHFDPSPKRGRLKTAEFGSRRLPESLNQKMRILWKRIREESNPERHEGKPED